MNTNVLKWIGKVFFIHMLLGFIGGAANASPISLTYTGPIYTQIASGSQFSKFNPTTGEIRLDHNPGQDPRLKMQITFDSAAVKNNSVSASDFKSFSFTDGGGTERTWRRKELQQYNSLCPLGTSPCFQLNGNINFLPNTYNISSWQLGYNSNINYLTSSSTDGDKAGYNLPRTNRYDLATGSRGAWSADLGSLAPIPVPATLPLMISGLLACGALFRRKLSSTTGV